MREFKMSDIKKDADRFTFSEDLALEVEKIIEKETTAECFGSMSNNEISRLLVKAGVCSDDEADSEGDRFYAYFKTRNRTKRFLRDLNEWQRQIKVRLDFSSIQINQS